MIEIILMFIASIISVVYHIKNEINHSNHYLLWAIIWGLLYIIGNLEG